MLDKRSNGFLEPGLRAAITAMPANKVAAAEEGIFIAWSCI